MSPLAFLADPARWLWAIHRHRATLSAAPNFAFELCLKTHRATPTSRASTSARCAWSSTAPSRSARAPSPASRSGSRRYGFAAGGDGAGLRPGRERRSGWRFRRSAAAPIIDRIDREALADAGHRRARAPGRSGGAGASSPAASRSPATRSASSTRPAARLPERQRGTARSSRGRRRPPAISATRRRRGRCSTATGWTAATSPTSPGGDVYHHRPGQGHHHPRRPPHLPAGAGGVRRQRRGGPQGLRGRDRQPRPRERHRAAGGGRRDAPRDRRGAGGSASGASSRPSGSILPDVPPEEIVLVPPHAVPKTSSGKMRRAATRELYEAGKLGRPERALRLAACNIVHSPAALLG